MVQLKYFGDSRDYFKYDLITFLLSNSDLKIYVFIPMLTKHRPDGEGKRLPKPVAGKSQKLISFIESCNSKDLNHWKLWIKPHVLSYRTIKPVNEIYFEDDTRHEYWKPFQELFKDEAALVFLDPDIGLETGKPSYLKKMGREKYILNHELTDLYNDLGEFSILMIYQHLPNNKHIHIEAVSKKINQAAALTRNAFICAYREDDLVFLFITKNYAVFEIVSESLKKYHKNSGHKYKSIHWAPNKANSTEAKSRVAD